MRVKSLIGGAVGDTAHNPGDVIECTHAQAAAWIEAGIAEPLETKTKRQPTPIDDGEVD